MDQFRGRLRESARVAHRGNNGQANAKSALRSDSRQRLDQRARHAHPSGGLARLPGGSSTNYEMTGTARSGHASSPDDHMLTISMKAAIMERTFLLRSVYGR